MDTDFVLVAIGLGYLQAGSNLLQRDLGGRAKDRPLYMASDGAALPHHIIAVLLWPVVRLVRRAPGVSPLRTLAFCALEWAFMAMISAGLLLAAGLFAETLVMQALIVLGVYGLMLASAVLRTAASISESVCALGRCDDVTQGGGVPGASFRHYADGHD